MTFAGERDEVVNPTEQYRGSEGFRPPGWAGPVGGAGRSVRPTATSAAPGPLGSVFTMSRFSRSVRSCTISQRSARIEKPRRRTRIVDLERQLVEERAARLVEQVRRDTAQCDDSLRLDRRTAFFAKRSASTRRPGV